MADEPVDVYAAGSELAGEMCWICQNRIMAGDEIVFCSNDKLPSHAECWEHNEGCPVYGCSQAPVSRIDVVALGAQTGEADFQCPNCRKRVKPSFLTCTFCGTLFELENIVYNLEYEDFQYRQEENDRLQRPLWWLLLLSVSGVLAPLALVLLIAARLKGSVGKWRFNRMFRGSRALFYGACGISAAYTLCFFVTMLIM